MADMRDGMRGKRAGALALSQDKTIGKFLPNGLTLMGLCSGATAIPFALAGEWKAAVTAIAIAAIFDMLDGRIARLLGADSKFGAQLDSLADLVSFGIAPSVLVYMWSLNHAGGAGWMLSLIFCVCSAIRLARFNIESTDEDAQAAHFTGVPTPVAACLILLPMILSFQVTADAPFRTPLASGAMMAAVSILMVSRIPTLSLKKLRVTRQGRGWVINAGGAILCAAILFPWATLAAALIAYLAMLPFGAARIAGGDIAPPDEPEL